MLFRFIFLVIVFYFVAKAVMKLFRLILADTQEDPAIPSRQELFRQQGWQTYDSVKVRKTSEDIEDARWVDVSDGEDRS